MSATSVRIFEVGHCLHPMELTWPGQGWHQHQYPSTAVLIQHDELGSVLFDTGYASHFFTATRYWPEKAYAMLTPVTVPAEQELLTQLMNAGIKADEISMVIMSHFHADHIAGVSDFKKAKFVYLQEGYQNLSRAHRLIQIKQGFLKSLLPSDFLMRSQAVTLSQFHRSQDFFDARLEFCDLTRDGSMKLVHLPGHAEGHLGLYVRSENKEYFFLADTCWHLPALKSKKLPSFATGFIFSDPKKYKETFFLASDLVCDHPKIQWIPCHCSQTLQSEV